MVRTILPLACPSPMYSSAPPTSLSSYRLSTTDRTLSALEKLSQSLHVRLVELRDEEDDSPAAAERRQAELHHVRQRAEQAILLRPPTRTTVAFGFSTRLHADHGLLPAMSNSMS